MESDNRAETEIAWQAPAQGIRKIVLAASILNMGIQLRLFSHLMIASRAHRSAIQYHVNTCPPREDAFNTDDNLISEWLYGFQEDFPIGFDVTMQFDLSGFIKDTEIHFVCVQVDSGIEFVLFSVKSHLVSSFDIGFRFLFAETLPYFGRETLNNVKGLAAGAKGRTAEAQC